MQAAVVWVGVTAPACWQGSWASLQGGPVQPWQGAVCGALAGGLAAAITTPLDVAKTRVMLAKVVLPGGLYVGLAASRLSPADWGGGGTRLHPPAVGQHLAAGGACRVRPNPLHTTTLHKVPHPPSPGSLLASSHECAGLASGDLCSWELTRRVDKHLSACIYHSSHFIIIMPESLFYSF